MATTVTVTVTPETSRNSFATIAAADAFVLGLFGCDADTWRAYTGDSGTDTKARLLITASRQISAGRWVGQKTDRTNALAWPRSQDEGADEQYTTDAIPPEVMRATVYQALYLLSGRANDSKAQRDGIRSVAVGGVSQSFTGRDSDICPEALSELASWRVFGAEIA